MRKRHYIQGHTSTLILGLAMLLLLAGCGKGQSNGIVEGKVNVVTSFYPIYEFARAIGGEDANVINLLPTGVEPHDWTPRSQDILNTSKAQLFFYNGAGLEGWVPNFLKGLGKDSTVKTVEVSQGIELIYTDEDDGHGHGEAAEVEHDDDHEHQAGNEDHDHDHGATHIDPHTWVSPKSAKIMAENMKNTFIEADPAHQANYEARYKELIEKLDALDAKFTSELEGMAKKEIVVSHQAFGYLCRDYGLTQHAIMGLSPDAEPRGQDLVKLSKLVKEEGIQYIFFEELVSDRLAKTLASEAGVETMVLNPVEGLTKEQEKAGDNYFTLMEKNLQNLKLALQ
ncbi:ABC transporter substrate-binding protein [Paenibacillus antibioticophila]|uniref:ABC transporter substrate-binding protein n=1 Tax=Paenibacillus antibioticophila TaxID=1274374 RepID=A0A919XWK8_9BACL|nr:metal ABC transporter substrate-binding protein [Paenibacillus antibioticophila]GIO38978.1 ABC transporter substrate-binding protein [Paenibacillus antibioticophila]